MDTILENWLVPRRAEITPGFSVGRVLPYRGGLGVGPWVFLDHMGPHTFAEGSDMDVPPHPHIGLATVTYLFDGEMDHRDSLGTLQRIRPGDVNWMTAGSGIVHSERAPPEKKSLPASMHGLQAWVALPVEHEEVSPKFEHQEKANLPTVEIGGVHHRLIAGNALGMRSPVSCFSRLFYVHFGMLLGGDPFPEHRRIWWNFVSSRPERIEEAKRKWQAQTLGQVPGETEFVPLPV